MPGYPAPWLVRISVCIALLSAVGPWVVWHIYSRHWAEQAQQQQQQQLHAGTAAPLGDVGEWFPGTAAELHRRYFATTTSARPVVVFVRFAAPWPSAYATNTSETTSAWLQAQRHYSRIVAPHRHHPSSTYTVAGQQCLYDAFFVSVNIADQVGLALAEHYGVAALPAVVAVHATRNGSAQAHHGAPMTSSVREHSLLQFMLCHTEVHCATSIYLRSESFSPAYRAQAAQAQAALRGTARLYLVPDADITATRASPEYTRILAAAPTTQKGFLSGLVPRWLAGQPQHPDPDAEFAELAVIAAQLPWYYGASGDGEEQELVLPEKVIDVTSHIVVSEAGGTDVAGDSKVAPAALMRGTLRHSVVKRGTFAEALRASDGILHLARGATVAGLVPLQRGEAVAWGGYPHTKAAFLHPVETLSSTALQMLREAADHFDAHNTSVRLAYATHEENVGLHTWYLLGAHHRGLRHGGAELAFPALYVVHGVGVHRRTYLRDVSQEFQQYASAEGVVGNPVVAFVEEVTRGAAGEAEFIKCAPSAAAEGVADGQGNPEAGTPREETALDAHAAAHLLGCLGQLRSSELGQQEDGCTADEVLRLEGAFIVLHSRWAPRSAAVQSFFSEAVPARVEAVLGSMASAQEAHPQAVASVPRVVQQLRTGAIGIYSLDVDANAVPLLLRSRVTVFPAVVYVSRTAHHGVAGAVRPYLGPLSVAGVAAFLGEQGTVLMRTASAVDSAADAEAEAAAAEERQRGPFQRVAADGFRDLTTPRAELMGASWLAALFFALVVCPVLGMLCYIVGQECAEAWEAWHCKRRILHLLATFRPTMTAAERATLLRENAGAEAQLLQRLERQYTRQGGKEKQQ